jgi:hypothetical protein
MHCLLGVHDAGAERVEIGELGVDAVQRGLQAPSLGLAGGVAGVVGGERVDGVGQGEADGLQFAGEPDAVDGLGLVVAVAGGGARGCREHADALVESDVRHAHRERHAR